jgi:hypothetical protein
LNRTVKDVDTGEAINVATRWPASAVDEVTVTDVEEVAGVPQPTIVAAKARAKSGRTNLSTRSVGVIVIDVIATAQSPQDSREFHHPV